MQLIFDGRGGMVRQMDISDFMEKPPESEQKPPRTQFEQLFEKVRDPVIQCANCLCQYCVNNAEGDKVRQGEMQEPCFICDECRAYDGDCRKQNQLKEECEEFVISDYGAERNRKKIKLIKR